MKTITAIVTAALVAGLWIRPAAADGNASYPYISKVNVGEDNYLYLNVTGNFSTAHGCSQPWYVRSKYALSDDRTKYFLQMALASFLSHKEVYVWTVGCTSYGYPILVQLQNQQP